MPISGLPVSLGTPVIDVPKSFIRRMESRRRFGEIRLRSHCFAGICAGHTGLCALLTVVSISVRRPARSFKAGKSLLLNAHDFATLPPIRNPDFTLSPTFKPFSCAGSAWKPMVIAGHLSSATGPWANVIFPL